MTPKDQEILEVLAEIESIRDAIILLYQGNPFQVLSPARWSELRVHTRILMNILVVWLRMADLKLKCSTCNQLRKLEKMSEPERRLALDKMLAYVTHQKDQEDQ